MRLTLGFVKFQSRSVSLMPSRQHHTPTVDRLPLKIGSVPYTNAWPLTRFLPEMFPGSVLTSHIPAQLQFRLIAHHLDIALTPLAALMELPTGSILGNACIACHGPVESVLIYAKRPLESLRHIAMDVSSRSSVLLAEILFREFYGVRPVQYQLAENTDPMETPTDAFLLIGDPALRFRQREPWEYRYDIGTLWKEKTGLPFVFAAWIACHDKHRDDVAIARTLQSARDRGCEDIAGVVADRASESPVSLERLHDYLGRSIRYTIGEEERIAIDTYFKLAMIHRLMPRRIPVSFVDP